MTTEEVQDLTTGLYRLYWNDGGYSLASVGCLHDGSKWFACSNWTGKTDSTVAASGAWWKQVKRVELVETW